METLKPLITLRAIGISPASFQVGGGMLLPVSSLQRVNAQPAESRREDISEGTDKADAGDSIAFVPLTIPLFTGLATNVMTRLKGLVLAALAVEVMSDGRVKLFPGLVGASR